MEPRHLSAWTDKVQPEIESVGRLDVRWPWQFLFNTFVANPSGGFNRTAWAISAGHEGRFPVALLLCFEGFKDFAEPDCLSVLVAYLAAAPLAALNKLTADYRPKSAGRAALDVAIVRSFREGFQGRVGAYAAQGAPDRLLEWYARQGLIRIPQEQPLASRWAMLPESDGRYFHHTQESARGALDANRAPLSTR